MCTVLASHSLQSPGNPYYSSLSHAIPNNLFEWLGASYGEGAVTSKILSRYPILWDKTLEMVNSKKAANGLEINQSCAVVQRVFSDEHTQHDGGSSVGGAWMQEDILVC